jgi:hypothetical protein
MRFKGSAGIWTAVLLVAVSSWTGCDALDDPDPSGELLPCTLDAAALFPIDAELGYVCADGGDREFILTGWTDEGEFGAIPGEFGFETEGGSVSCTYVVTESQTFNGITIDTGCYGDELELTVAAAVGNDPECGADSGVKLLRRIVVTRPHEEFETRFDDNQTLVAMTCTARTE